MTYRVRNWEKFQHYKNRNPPWIKLHFELLSSSDWVTLDDKSRVLVIACMLIASRNGGMVPSDPLYVQRVAYLKDIPDFEPLISCGFLQDSASKLLASASIKSETGLVKSETGLVKSETGLVKSDTEKPLLNKDLQVNASKLLASASIKALANARPETETYKQETETEKEKHFSPTFSSEDMDVAVRIADLKNLLYPKHIKPDLKSWAKTIRLMRTIDKRTHGEINESWEWVMQDDFWGGVCLSPNNLRKNWDRIQIKRNKRQNTNKSWQEQEDEKFLKG